MDRNEFDNITPEAIKQLLENSGYLFEQRVASVIENLGYASFSNKAYLDAEEGKSREIDVLAMKIFKIENTGMGVSCYINCECKNSTTPFVFITRNKGVVDRNYVPDGLYFVPEEYKKSLGGNRYSITNSFNQLNLRQYHFATREDYKAVQISKIVRNQKKIEAQHSGVIESFVYPLVKSNKEWVRNYGNKKTTQFFFNLVIVNSPLYIIDSENKDALPRRVNFVPFVRDVQTKEIKGNHLITFVNFDILEFFIKTEIEGFCQKVNDIYKSNPALHKPDF